LVPPPLTLTVDPARAALGEQLFQDVRLTGQNTVACATCHQLALGGADGHPQALSADDPGRFRVTGLPRDRGVFRVPSLRNVVLTAPYFHDGRARTLEDAVETMARVQLGRTLTSAEISLIVQFLHTLTGDFQGRSLADHAEEAR
jgi:cytochrome c peroxidase